MDDFQEKAKKKSERKYKERQRKGLNALWGFSIFGLVGWTVVIPTLIGVFLGLWIDLHYQRGSYSWTLMLLFLGLMIGCILAWNLSKREITHKDDDDDK